MSEPDLFPFNGDWKAYEDCLYAIFIKEIASGDLSFQSLPVQCKRLPETQKKWFLFWHLIQEGKLEEERTPDLRRCERLGWIPWVIRNAGVSSEIDVWENERKNQKNALLWFRKEYLVVLAKRRDYWLLKTAYCTEARGRIQKLEKERDAYNKGRFL